MEQLARFGKFKSELFQHFGAFTQGPSKRFLANNPFEQDAKRAIRCAYQLARLWARQPRFIDFPSPVELVKPHLFQLCGIKLQQNVRVVTLNIAFAKLSSPRKFIILNIDNFLFHILNIYKNRMRGSFSFKKSRHLFPLDK